METKLEVLLWWRVFRAQQKQRCTFAYFSYAKQRRFVVKLYLDNFVVKTALPTPFNLSLNTEEQVNTKTLDVNKYNFIFIVLISFTCWMYSNKFTFSIIRFILPS